MVFGAFDTFVQNLKSHLIQFLIIVSLSSLSPPKRRLSQTSNRLRLRATRLQEMASLFVGVPNSHLRRAYDGWHRWDYGQDNAWTQSYKVTQSCKSILYWLSHSYQLWLSKQNWYMFFSPGNAGHVHILDMVPSVLSLPQSSVQADQGLGSLTSLQPHRVSTPVASWGNPQNYKSHL